ncbi:hypothetical protein PanWU01x14_019820, partial [Parasponia andersonii]
TKALKKFRRRNLLRCLQGALVDFPQRLISALVVKAYYSTWNQGAFMGAVIGISRHL